MDHLYYNKLLEDIEECEAKLEKLRKLLAEATPPTDIQVKKYEDSGSWPAWPRYPQTGDKLEFTPSFSGQSVCDSCSNHPNNGGSGFCNCTLGLTPIY